MLPFIGLALLVSAKLDRRVEWRGRSYALDPSARLASARGPKRVDIRWLAPR